MLTVGIHPEVVALDAELRAVGGCACFDMDDGYAVGPAHVAFAAVRRFAVAVQAALGLVSVEAKLACYSRLYPLHLSALTAGRCAH